MAFTKYGDPQPVNDWATDEEVELLEHKARSNDLYHLLNGEEYWDEPVNQIDWMLQ